MQKIAPLIILAVFAIGMFFMMQGMDNAVAMTKEKVEITK
jgi:hypothetical protein